MEGSVVIAIADVSGEPHRVAYAGEVMTTIAMRLGAIGMVTDGALRDVDEVHALGFHYFMQYPVVSHANFEVTSVGEPIELGGQRVETGDILHGDGNGIVIVPDAALDGLPAAVEQVRQKEAETMAFVRGDDFDYARLKQLSGY
jgi:regulator of RNase E activity RraA